MTEKQRQAIKKHGRNLQAIFPAAADLDPVTLCKKLRRIEVAANAKAVAYCNGEIDCDQWGQFSDATAAKVDAILGFRAAGVPVVVNGDPRGYALKIKEDWTREHDCLVYRDWGGYGIIAPEINAEGH